MAEKTNPGTADPVFWDTSHWMDLAVKDAQDKSQFVKTFLSRTNSFNEMFGHGRGFEEFITTKDTHNLEGVYPKNYSVTRFSSSALSSLISVYQGYKAFITTFIEYRETESDVDQMKYRIRGSDYALSLCFMLDLLKPIKLAMEKVQAVSSNVWTAIEAFEEVTTHLNSINDALKEVTEV